MLASPRLRRLAGALAASAVVLATLAPAAPAQQGERTRVLSLVDQTTWLRADSPFTLRVLIDTRRPARNLELAMTVFGRVPFRSQFAQTLDGRNLGSVLAHQTVPLTSTEPAADGTITLAMTPPLRRAGVYPARIELRDVNDEEPVSRLTTHAIYLPDVTYAAPLHVASIIPVDASPTVTPKGERGISKARASALNSLGQALQARPRVTASLLPAGDTLEALAGGPASSTERAALASVERAGSGRGVLASPYVSVDIDGLLDAGLVREAHAQLERGRDAAERLLDREPGTHTWVSTGPLDVATIAWLQDRGFRQFVTREAAFEPVRLATTLTAPFQIEVPAGDNPLAATIDSGLSRHFERTDQPVVAAHRLLADLAVIYFDHPGREGRGIVLAPPRRWQPDPAFLAAFLGGLEDSPILATTTVDRFFDTVPTATARGAPLVRRLATVDDRTPLPATSIDAARRRLDSFGTLLERGNERLDDFESLLLTAQSNNMSASRRSAYLRGFHDVIDAELALVEIPDRQSIRLTARRGDVPIPILSRTGYPVRVLVRVQGATLDFPEGGERLVHLTNETTTERFPVQARSSGAFPLRVTVLTPDGGLAVAGSRFTVRSTAASWVGLALSAGAALFLIVWWGRHIHGRRSGKLVPT